MPSIQFNELYQAEAVKGEKAAYFLRWLIVVLLIGGALIMVLSGRYLEVLPYSFFLIGIALFYNIALTVLYKKNRLHASWIKYVSVTIDISLITVNHYITSLYANVFAVATFATILLYPVFLLYATLRHNRGLVIYATLYSLLIFNLSYYFIYPRMDPELLALVASADPIGHVYKSLYIGLFGFSLLLVPRTIRNLIGKQAVLVEEKMQKEFEIKLHKQREEQLIQNLYQYVSKEVAEKLIKDPDLLKGKTVHVTALFVDIRGFTAFCASREAEEILDFLNDFYSTVSGAIKRYNGLVNKYLGDSVFAIFGAPDQFDNTEQKAISACIEVLHQMDAKRSDFKSNFGVDLNIGIGIESGNVLVGNVGSTDRIEYTALGDAVNMASRYESLNKHFKTRILFSSSVKDAIEGYFSDIEIAYLGKQEVRGSQGERSFYTIKGLGQL